MKDRDRCLVVIPARFESTRLPGKPLISLAGRPMVQHVYERCVQAGVSKRVLVATDDRRVFEAVESFGGEAVMTSSSCSSGLDRVAEVAAAMDHRYVIDVQGDEPLIPPESLRALVDRLTCSGCEMVTLAIETDSIHEANDPHIVKVVVGRDMKAMYFSRSVIPSFNGRSEGKWLKHAGIYGFRRDVLLDIASTPPTELEMAEKLEQLRAMELGYTIEVITGDWFFKGVDVQADVDEVERILSEVNSQ
jgi:3-deoxy-manno-octulosonate cytidylyltransferase (CMP-KDO synthetase)